MEKSLDEIGVYFGTDKSSLGHDFLEYYELYFKEFRNRSITLLEFGVLKGQSLMTWGEYFVNGKVIGVDIVAEAKIYEGDNRVVEISDQSNIAELVRLASKYGPFDIIIDDASHLWDHQIVSLQYMYPHVKAGGYYVVEDTHTSFGNLVNDYKGLSNVSAADYINKFSDSMMGGKFMNAEKEPDAFIRTFASRTSFIVNVSGGTSIIRRKP